MECQTIFCILIGVMALYLIYILSKNYYKSTISRYLLNPSIPKEALLQGKRKMKSSSIIICGLARDIERTLPRNLERCERIGNMFADVYYIFYENDSKDGTKEILQQFCGSRNNALLLSENLDVDATKKSETDTTTQRTQRMAMYRNKMIEHMPKNFDFVCVVDLDAEGDFSEEGIADCFANCDWDMICAYGVDNKVFEKKATVHMYDTFAFRTRDFVRPYPPRRKGKEKFKLINKLNKLYTQRETQARIPITSGFNGIAFYRREIFDNCRYDGSDCEHICFSDCMIKNGYDKMLMNLNLVGFI